MSIDPRDFDEFIREVTDEEVAHFHEHGWVFLPQLVQETLAREVLEHLKALTGINADTFPDDPAGQAKFIKDVQDAHIAYSNMPRLKDDWLQAYAENRKLGASAARLSGHRRMRLWSDTVMCKLPDGTGMNQATNWHQDMPAMPLDRAGGVQFWLALTEIVPEMGSMQHLSGSHREPPRGRQGYNGTKLGDDYPELWEKYELSEAKAYRPGDVMSHDALTVHYAQPNQTNRLRWAYLSYRIPAETIYTGAPNVNTDGLGFKINDVFDHEKFPIVAG